MAGDGSEYEYVWDSPSSNHPPITASAPLPLSRTVHTKVAVQSAQSTPDLIHQADMGRTSPSTMSSSSSPRHRSMTEVVHDPSGGHCSCDHASRGVLPATSSPGESPKTADGSSSVGVRRAVDGSKSTECGGVDPRTLVDPRVTMFKRGTNLGGRGALCQHCSAADSLNAGAGGGGGVSGGIPLMEQKAGARNVSGGSSGTIDRRVVHSEVVLSPGGGQAEGRTQSKLQTFVRALTLRK